VTGEGCDRLFHFFYSHTSTHSQSTPGYNYIENPSQPFTLHTNNKNTFKILIKISPKLYWLYPIVSILFHVQISLLISCLFWIDKWWISILLVVRYMKLLDAGWICFIWENLFFYICICMRILSVLGKLSGYQYQ